MKTENRPRVLVVDDDTRVVQTLRTMLQSEGYRVETSANGLEAYQRIKSTGCECLLLDVNMPKINGVELLLLMQTEGLRVPTIVMAGFEDFEEREMKKFSNVVAFLKKPFDSETLTDTVRKHVAPCSERRPALSAGRATAGRENGERTCK